MNRIAVVPGIGSAVLIMLFVPGCRDTVSDVIEPSAAIEVPDEFQDKITTWQRRKPMQHSDTDCLSRFFAARRELAGSPELDGPPLLFVSGSDDRCFFWLTPTATGTQWSAVRFVNGKFTFSEGTGSPFAGDL